MDKFKTVSIPRPVTKRQYSGPATYGCVSPINLSDAVAKISNGPRSCTNPFLNGSFGNSIPEDDNLILINEKNNRNENIELAIIKKKNGKNPFSDERPEENLIFSFPPVNIDSEQCTIITETNGAILEETNNRLNGSDTNMGGTDTLGVNIFDNLDNYLQKQFRNRSLSETGATETDVREKNAQEVDEEQSKNPFAGSLYKAVSETYLEQYSNSRGRSGSQTWSFGRSVNRQMVSSTSTIKSLNVQNTLSSESLDTDLKRAMSCDSVNSDSSVLITDLEQQTAPIVTGMLCIGLQFDK